VNRRFGAIYHLHLQGQKSSDQEIKVKNVVQFARLIFDPEDGDDTPSETSVLI
jgi:hypothetical protein